MKSFLNRLYKKIKWYYFMYDLHTSLYMLESWEKRVFRAACLVSWAGVQLVNAAFPQHTSSDIGLVAVVAMSSYTTCIFLPRYTQNVLRYFGITE